jgi:hypothetical protein
MVLENTLSVNINSIDELRCSQSNVDGAIASRKKQTAMGCDVRALTLQPQSASLKT